MKPLIYSHAAAKAGRQKPSTESPKTSKCKPDEPVTTGSAETATTDAQAPLVAEKRLPAPGFAELMGSIVSLFMASPNHKFLFMSDLDWLVIPPVRLKQFGIRQRRMSIL